jgi:acetolactate decarboxylase
MTEIWQNIPSMAFMKGLYQGLTTIKEARNHGNFGVGQFAALDGELIVTHGGFYRATSDGKVRLADDADELCFAQLCYYNPQQKPWTVPANSPLAAFESFLPDVFPFNNDFCAFRITGRFAGVVPTSPPLLQEPFPSFAQAKTLRKSFPRTDIEGTMVGYYSPPFAGSVGVPGFHFHFISDDRSSGGHVEEFTLAEGSVSAERIEKFKLTLPDTRAYRTCVLP